MKMETRPKKVPKERHKDREANRYPEEEIIDVMLETDSGDDIPPSSEEVFSGADPRR